MEDRLAGRSSSAALPTQYHNKSLKELEILVSGREAKLKQMFVDVLRQYGKRVEDGENGWSLELLRHKVIEARKTLDGLARS